MLCQLTTPVKIEWSWQSHKGSVTTFPPEQKLPLGNFKCLRPTVWTIKSVIFDSTWSGFWGSTCSILSRYICANMQLTLHFWSTSSQKATSIATNYIKFSSFFMGFHKGPLLKRMVWLKILYIQKSDELCLETVVFVKKT